VLAALVGVAITSLALCTAPLVLDSTARAAIPAAGSSTTGAWSELIDWPVIAIHAVLAADGKVVTWGAGAGTGQGAAHFFDVWDPAAGEGPDSHSLNPNPVENIFCAGQHVSPTTGEILVFGGQTPGGNDQLTSFAPATHELSDLDAPMAYPRWYPTTTTLPDGRTLVQGGTDDGFGGTPIVTPELYTPGSGWRTLTGATSEEVYGNVEGRPGWYYPRTWVQPDGRVFALSQRAMYYIDPEGSGRIDVLDQQWTRGLGETATAVMYEPGRILHVGGHAGAGRGSADASIIDLTGEQPVVTPTSSMAAEREWADSTVLPDGTVLVTGGSAQANALVDVALNPELWDPATGEWTELEAGQLARLYHSTSLLLPDGSVLVAGGGEPGPLYNLNAEIFYPPYLFGADGAPAARPSWRSTPGEIPYGRDFTASVEAGRQIERVTLVKTGSVTHSFDMEQRFIELSFAPEGDLLTIAGPADANVATPGHYLLFAVDDRGVPSVARIARVGADASPVAPEPPAAEPPRATSPTSGATGETPPLGATRPRLAMRNLAARRVRRGGLLTYRLVLRNRGRQVARGVTVVDRLPRSLRLVRSSRRVAVRRGRVVWRAGNVGVGRRKALVLRFRVPRTARGRIVARATAKGRNTRRVGARRITRVRP
jgi:uncharacterized repeat protein (TIGR01451 family)